MNLIALPGTSSGQVLRLKRSTGVNQSAVSTIPKRAFAGWAPGNLLLYTRIFVAPSHTDSLHELEKQAVPNEQPSWIEKY